MVITLGSLSQEVLEMLLKERKKQFEEAFDKGESIEALNKIYAELKACQAEINLREAQARRSNKLADNFKASADEGKTAE